MSTTQAPVDTCESFGSLIQSANLKSYTIALLLGLSFSSVITNFSNGVILPAFSSLFRKNIGQGYVVLRQGENPENYTKPDDVLQDSTAITITYGKLVNAIVIFLINLIVVFIIFRVGCGVTKRFNKKNSLSNKMQL